LAADFPDVDLSQYITFHGLRCFLSPIVRLQNVLLLCASTS
jgi:hypothetical protein